jgi:hypothetical protein
VYPGQVFLICVRFPGCAADGKDEHEQQHPYCTDDDSDYDHWQTFLLRRPTCPSPGGRGT